MLDLLKIEWLKVKRYNTFWILSVLFLSLLFLGNYLVGSGALKLGGGVDVFNTSYSFPNVWNNVGYLTKVFSGLIAIIIIILTTNEYQFKTNRQNLIDGLQRVQFFHAKWGIVIALSAFITVFTLLEGILFGLYNGSSLADAGKHLEKILYVFILTLNYFSFALTLSLFLRKSGMTIIIFLLYGYIVEFIIKQFVEWKFQSHITNFLPMDSSAYLLTFPVLETLKQMAPSSTNSDTSFIIASIFWISIYYIAGRIRLLKSDW